jgi:cell division protein FtsQ
MTLVTVAALVLYFSPLLGVRSVRVAGTTTLNQQTVVAAAGIPQGTPMLQVDTGAIQRKLGAVPQIATVTVRLRWPSTVLIELTERHPVASVASGNGFELVDPSDVVFKTVAQAPPGLPQFQGSPDTPAGHAAITVLAALPPALSAQVVSATAPTPDDVRLTLNGGREVDWGGAENSQRKADVLPTLLSQPGRVYDVRSPDLVTISG